MAEQQHNSTPQIQFEPFEISSEPSPEPSYEPSHEPSPEPCVEPVLPNIPITKEQCDILIKRIENEIKIKKNDSETQGNSKQHEKDVAKIIIETFGCQVFNKDLFNKFITKKINKEQHFPSKFKMECPKLSNKILDDFIKKYNLENIKCRNISKKTEKIKDKIKDNPELHMKFKKLTNCDMDENKLYLVEQPFGSQSYPDFILFYINEGYFHLRYIECKQLKPTWNNSPPKNNRNCIYICGNKVYCGDCITNIQENELDINFMKEYDELCKKYNLKSNELKLNKKYITYKKVEHKCFPPEYFNEEINNHNIIQSFISI